MKSKFHWGHGVLLAMFIFVIFISTFVYKTLFMKDYDHELVSEEYYKDEMAYQQEMTRIQNAEQLKENVKIQHTEDGILIIFPSMFTPSKISGTVEFQRANDTKLDINKTLELETSELLIPNDALTNGFYNVKILWHYDGMDYQINEKVKY